MHRDSSGCGGGNLTNHASNRLTALWFVHMSAVHSMKYSLVSLFLALAASADAAIVSYTMTGLSYQGSSGGMGGPAPVAFVTGDVASITVYYNDSLTAIASNGGGGPSNAVTWSQGFQSMSITITRGGTTIYNANLDPTNASGQFGDMMNEQAQYNEFGSDSNFVFSAAAGMSGANGVNPTLPNYTYEGSNLAFSQVSLGLINQGALSSETPVTVGQSYSIAQVFGDGSGFGLGPDAGGTMKGASFSMGNWQSYSYTFGQAVMAVPEPGSLALVAIAAPLVLRRRRTA